MAEYEKGRSMKHVMSVPTTEEDCPNRARFLKELEARRGWAPSDWRKVLGVTEAPREPAK
jgi:hypothetical protein